MTRDLTPGETEFLGMMREARASREANGVTNHQLDPVWEAAERGEFPPGIAGSSGTEERDAFNQVMDAAKAASLDVAARPNAGAPARNQFGAFQVKYASPGQVRYIAMLLRTKDLTKATDRGAKVIEVSMPQVKAEKINKKHASALLDVLVGLPEKPVHPGDPDAGKRPNRYGGKCVHCGHFVQAEAGWLTKDASGKWASEHRFGACPTTEAPKAPELPEVPEGRYATIGEDGAVDFWQIDRPTEGRWEGYVFLSQLTGSPGSFNRAAIKPMGLKVAIFGKIAAAGIEKAARLFGQRTKTCGHCSSPLTKVQSRCAGYGPVCSAKHGYWYPSEAEALAWETEWLAAHPELADMDQAESWA